jgi:aspartate racemase
MPEPEDRFMNYLKDVQRTNLESMNKSRCLGLVGGLGVGATMHYYKELAKAHEAQGHRLDIVIAHAETSRVFEYVQAGERDGLAEYLTGFIRRLKGAGAEVAAIPAITPHFCVQELVAVSPLPLFNIFEPLVQELKARSVRRIAVFGARYAVESDLFGFVEGVEIVRPRADEVDYIHETYVELLQQGKGSEERHRNMTMLADTLRRRDGVETIVFAGTDLVVLFNDANTEFPYVDCAALHINAILKGLWNEAPLNSHGMEE